MKRFWRIISSRSPGEALLCWAADSRIGAVCVVLLWLVSHIGLGFAIATGRSGFFVRQYEAEMFWIELGTWALGLLFVDIVIVVGIVRDHRKKRPNKAPEPTTMAVTPRATSPTSK